MRRIKLLIALFLFSIILQAQDSEDMYALTWKRDGYIQAGIVGLYAADYFIFERSIPILTENDINLFDGSTINRFDRSAIFNSSESANHISDICRDVTPFLPLTLLFSKRAKREAGNLGIMYLQVITLTNAITRNIKSVVRRKRPLLYNAEFTFEQKKKKSSRKSFFSGHTSLVAGITFFSASVFADYYPDSKYKPLAWAGAFSISALTAYTRYEAGRHFPSDVIVGFGVGALIGYYVPKLHKLKKKSGLSIAPTGNGIYLSKNLN